LGLENPEFTGLPNPNHLSPGRYQTFECLVRASGGRVLLTGLGGDHLFWSVPEGAPLVADALRRGHLLGAFREARIWAEAAKVPILNILLNRAILSAIGRSFQVFEAPTWLSPKMQTVFSVHRAELLGNQSTQIDPSRSAQLFAVDLFFRMLGCGYFNEYRDLYVSHPYTHRPLVEFCLGTPLSQFLRAGKTRSLMRRALVDRLPTKICNRVSKVGADEAYVRALQREWAGNSDVRRWSVCTRGLIDSGKLSDSLNAMYRGIHQQTGYLMRLVSMERWLRSLDSISRSGETPTKGPTHDSSQVLDAV
jgi:asparagine synthase (glutamine-hydrolysing)